MKDKLRDKIKQLETNCKIIEEESHWRTKCEALEAERDGWSQRGIAAESRAGRLAAKLQGICPHNNTVPHGCIVTGKALTRCIDCEGIYG